MKKPLFYKASVLIQATPEEVWDALVNPEITPYYMFNCQPITDWKPGSPLLWRGLLDGAVYVHGSVLRYEPYALLSFTSFNPQGAYADVPENYLTTTYTLKKGRDGLELTISQGDFAMVEDGVARFQDAEGWAMVLEGIREVAQAQDELKEDNSLLNDSVDKVEE